MSSSLDSTDQVSLVIPTMSSASEVSGLRMRSGRVIPRRNVNRSASPHDDVHTSERVEADRSSEVEGSANSSNQLVDDCYSRGGRRLTRRNELPQSLHNIDAHSCDGSGRYSRASNASFVRREKLAAELKAQEAIAELEKQLILKRLELQKADIDNTAGNEPDDDPLVDPHGAPLVDPHGNPLAKPRDDPLAKPHGDPLAKPRDDPFAKPYDDPLAEPYGGPLAKPHGDPRINDQLHCDAYKGILGEVNPNHKTRELSGTPAETVNEKIQRWAARNKSCDVPSQESHMNELQQKWSSPSHQQEPPCEMRMLLARQGGIKELPNFSGDSTEWPAFITQFKRSTTVCGYSNDENLLRLQKCLKGKARETVGAMLSLPENVPVVIAALERRFGRPELIISDMISKVSLMHGVRDDKPDSIIDLSNAVIGLVSSMESLGHKGHLMNPSLLQELVGKLTPTMRLQWGAVAAKGPVDVSAFSSWLLTIADAASFVQMPCTSGKREERTTMEKKFHKREAVFTTTTSGIKPKQTRCGICNGTHQGSDCKEFQRCDVESRWKLVRRKSLCFRCLGRGHSVRECNSKIDCNVEGCDRLHHPMLHHGKQRNPRENEVGGTVLSHTTYSTNRVLLRILPVTLYGPAGSYKTHALLDEASTVTLLTQSVADAIGATGESDVLRLQWTSNMMQSNENSQRVAISIAGSDGRRYNMDNVRTVENLSLPLQSVDGAKLRTRWKHLQEYEVPTLACAKPTILLGQDNCHLIIARTVVEGEPNAPVLSQTKLGWTLHGNVPFMKRVDADFTFLTNDVVTNGDLHECVKRFFTTEEFGVKVPPKTLMGKNDARALEILRTTTANVGERYEAGLLWRTDNPSFPSSEAVALRRLKQMEKRMDSDSLFAEQYCRKIEEYVEKGYATKLTDADLRARPSKWFLPHFAVVNENKPGKIRFVFDAAAKSNGVSLNDMLLSGPDLLVPLPYVLFRFRTNEVAIGGDIKEMFHQVNIRLEDRAAQRFLWRGRNRNTAPSIYEMKAMTFGATSSPTTAQYVKNENAARFMVDEPEAYKAILQNHYVDDYLDSVCTEAEAIQRASAVIRVHAAGGFEIRNWSSSSTNVLQSIPEHLRAISDQQLIGGETLPCERILGIKWDPNEDVFLFSAKLKTGGEVMPATKREILRIVMSLFDPLGFLANYTVRAKILLQDIWRLAFGWDDEVAGDTQHKWNQWVNALPAVRNMKVRRPYSARMRERYEVELHVLCDASEQAFAAVAYLRITGPNFTHVAFVMGKSRVAPLKPMSIPRLELQAAVMGSRLAQTIMEGHHLQIEKKYFWTDSRTVLGWIRSDARRYKQFVSHRVGEILESTEIEDWHWIPTAQNVADDATRDAKPIYLGSDSRWLNGPEFLWLSKEDWPHEPSVEHETVEDELKKDYVAVHAQPGYQFLPDAERFSSWVRLLRTTVRVLKFIQLCGKNRKGVTKAIDAADLLRAELHWIHFVQEQCFPEDLCFLRAGRGVNKQSKLAQLCPFLDPSGTMRVRGRQQNVELSSNSQCQIILPPNHKYTKLLIKHHHEQANHCGREMVLNELRQKYWVVDGRAAVRSAWNTCNACRVRRAKPIQPQMGLLPECRLGIRERPFTYTGVDYYGPMIVTVKRRKEKRYGVIFTCLTTRAVHLELAVDLTTDVCLMAVRRFMARRGEPAVFYSDNGRNFRGASAELTAAYNELKQTEIIEKLALRRIEWRFNPPSTPHMGGCWERLIRSIKTSMHAVLRERAPREDTLHTLLVEIEAILNSRPLTHVSLDHEDAEALTPNHFLMGTSGLSCFAGGSQVPSSDGCLRKQWRISQSLADMFWCRWIREYSPTLTKRTKWFKPVKPLSVNDLVMLIDDAVPRGCWLRGKVVATHPGRDGQVRVVDVKTKLGTYRRSASKLAVLELYSGEET